MNATQVNQVELVSEACNGFDGRISVNGDEISVYKEKYDGKNFRRLTRYGVRVAPEYNRTGIEWVCGRNIQSIIQKLRNDKRKLVGEPKF